MVLNVMYKFTILLLSLILTSCSPTGQLSFNTQFPKTSPILSEKDKTELKRKIAIKNSELFTDEELQSLGVLEVVIK